MMEGQNKTSRLLKNTGRIFDKLMKNIKDIIEKIVIKRSAWIVGTVISAFFLGILSGGSGGRNGEEHKTYLEQKPGTVWTCSMHPQIRLQEFGQCPICFMDLIPLAGSGEKEDLSELVLSDKAVSLASVHTTEVRRKKALKILNLSGKIEADESRIKRISARVDGRLERLYVDFEGVRVNRGEHLMDIYSPGLYAAQEELIQAVKQMRQGGGGLGSAALLSTVQAAEDKLRFLGITDVQISEISDLESPKEVLTVYSPAGGVIIEKSASEGDYVKTGTPVYTIADLSRVWAVLDAYAEQISSLYVGQPVTVRAENMLGVNIKGTVDFIDPVMDVKKRTVAVRVNMANPDGYLKPGVFVRAEIEARLNEKGDVFLPDLSGRFICSMHPEILKNASGACDICGMRLIPAEVGKTSALNNRDPLIIPVEAVLKTGKRAIVYVYEQREEKHVFSLREVALGPETESGYIVLEGLAEGEPVVTRGAFRIDSAMQIAGKRSMMNDEPLSSASIHEGSADANQKVKEERGTDAEGEFSRLPVDDAYTEAVLPVFDAYFQLQRALSGDDARKGKKAAGLIREALADFTTADPDLSPEASEIIDTCFEKLDKILVYDRWRRVPLEQLRRDFDVVSEVMLTLERKLGHQGGTVYEAFCPMAFDNRGAFWIQTDSTIANPYFGSQMLRCGEIRGVFQPLGSEGGSHE